MSRRESISVPSRSKTSTPRGYLRQLAGSDRRTRYRATRGGASGRDGGASGRRSRSSRIDPRSPGGRDRGGSGRRRRRGSPSRELGESVLHLRGSFRGERLLFRPIVVLHTGERAEIFQRETLDEARAMTALRTHEHERLVGRDAKEPRREARFTAERSESAEHLHERRLEEIAAILVATG